jgi:hypothetical protein
MPAVRHQAARVRTATRAVIANSGRLAGTMTDWCGGSGPGAVLTVIIGRMPTAQPHTGSPSSPHFYSRPLGHATPASATIGAGVGVASRGPAGMRNRRRTSRANQHSGAT